MWLRGIDAPNATVMGSVEGQSFEKQGNKNHKLNSTKCM